MKIKVYDIKWEKDNQSVNLPASTIVDVAELNEVADKLSDKYGFLVSEFQVRIMKNRPNLVKLTKSISNAMATAMDNGYKISLPDASELIDEEDHSYWDSIWHGGNMLTLAKNSIEIAVDAVGDVECFLCGYDGNELCSVKDRNNAGRFREEFCHEIHGDAELNKISSGKDKANRTLNWQNNNWYEAFVYYNGEFLHSDVVEGDIVELMNDLDSIIAWSEEIVADYHIGTESK